MTRLLGILGDNVRRVLVIGIGGGGDIVGSIPTYLAVNRSSTARAYLAGIPWERFTVDPEPGPLSLNSFHGLLEKRGDYGVVYGPSYAVHGGNTLLPQVSRVANVLGDKILVFDVTGGFNQLYDGIVNAIYDYSIDAVIGIDVGGDVLATGFEEELWSPLLDHLALSVLYEVGRRLGVEVYIGVYGLGCDGELPLDKLEEYVSLLSVSGFFKGGIALTIEDVKIVEKVLEHTITEASRCPIKVFWGSRGYQQIRGGTRSVKLTTASLMTLIFDVEGVYRHSSIARYLIGTRSILEAKEVLNSLGIYTELDLEYDLSELSRRGKTTILDVISTRSLRRMRLKCQA